MVINIYIYTNIYSYIDGDTDRQRLNNKSMTIWLIKSTDQGVQFKFQYMKSL